MKKLLIIILGLFGMAQAQTVGQFKYDTTKFLKTPGFNEVMIQNRTMDTLGIAVNKGKGLIRWERPKAVPGGIKIGNDTILIAGGSGSVDSVRLDSVSASCFRMVVYNGASVLSSDTICFEPGGGGGGSPKAYAPLVVRNDTLFTEFNPLSYGADSTGVANSTLAFQQAMDAAHAVNGMVNVPRGEFKIDSLRWYPNISMKGAGWQATTLKSNSAVRMFSYYNPTIAPDQVAGSISDMKLEGNTVGTYGIDLEGIYLMNYYNLSIRNFTVKGVNLVGCIGHYFYSCIFAGNETGIAIDENAYSSANFNYMENCGYYGNRTWGVTLANGSDLTLVHPDFEVNGTTNNLNTGSIKVSNMCPSGERNGLNIFGGWAERNNGTTMLFENSRGAARHYISNFMIQYPDAGGATVGVNLVQTSSFDQSVIINGGSVLGHTTDVITDGAYATNDLTKTVASVHTEVNSGSYGVNTVFLPDISSDSYFKIRNKAVFGGVSTRLGTTGANQYAWFTNMYYTGSAWTRDDATQGGWRMFKAIDNTDAGSLFGVDYMNVAGTINPAFSYSVGKFGINTYSPAASAALDVTSTTTGLLPPRMTTTQKNAISSPAEGLMVYDLTLHKLCVYTGSVWETITSL